MKAAEAFPGKVDVVHLDALGPEAEPYGLMVTPVMVVGDEVVAAGRVLSASRLIPILQTYLEDEHGQA